MDNGQCHEAPADYQLSIDHSPLDEVPAGYKRTEVGVIPEDWDVSQVDSLISEISMGPFGSDIKVSNFVSSGVPVLNGFNVSSERLIDSFTNYVTQEKAKRLKKAVASRGDIVVTHRGTIGQISYIPSDSKYEKYVISQSQFRVRFRKDVLPSWVTSYFLSDKGALALLEGKGHTGVPAIAQPTTTFRKLKIPVPPIEEQRAIATALSDVDALIAALDKLIAKKRAIKTAAMQQLLTGKTRLPGFSGEWETKRLGELAEVVSGGTPKSGVAEYWDGGIFWCTPTDVTKTQGKYIDGSERTISKEGLLASSAHLLPPGSILLCTRATIGEMKISTVPIATNQGFKSLVCKEDVSSEFLYYKLLMEKGRLIEKASGSTFLEISKRDVVELTLRLPEIEEQTAIAQVLSDMDAEIAALETRRDKTRAIKQGMMQQLLTGKIRLV